MKKINDPGNYINFLGILEGKRKAVIEEEKRLTMQMEADIAAAPKKEANMQQIMLIGIVLVFVVIILYLNK